MNKKIEQEWKSFERLVAAIQQVEHNGAKVLWNDKINGRQFDITIRFQYGIHEYLTVIECKKNQRPISIEIIEAFITKANDAKANKAIMVSSSRYQEGCTKIAQKHNIELLTLTEINKIPKEILSNAFIQIFTKLFFAMKIYLLFDFQSLRK
ncbi:MAG: restriction endonuclease [Deltaproteobacteria bacterium]|nr:restriction endonuclease [Deltaproteobacteria bacterium]